MMSKGLKAVPPALKHGLYSGMALLPQEDEAEHEKHRRAVFDEYKPNGPSELDTVNELSSLLWRKKHLLIYKLAANAKLKRSSFFTHQEFASPSFDLLAAERLHTPEEMRELDKKATERAKVELGAWLELVEIGEVATTEYLLGELDIIERINGMIDRCIKRLLMIRGAKSLSESSSTNIPLSRGKKAA
jgi:hypothetical protein